MWRRKMNEARINFDNAQDDESKAYWSKVLETYQEAYFEAQQNVNKSVEESIQDTIDKYKNAVSKIFSEVEKSMTNGIGFEAVKDEWDSLNEYTDRYLDKVDALYELDAIDNAFNDAMDKAAGNSKAQQALTNLYNT